MSANPEKAPRIASANKDALPLTLSSAEETSSIVFSIAALRRVDGLLFGVLDPFARPTIMSTPSSAIRFDGEAAPAASLAA